MKLLFKSTALTLLFAFVFAIVPLQAKAQCTYPGCFAGFAVASIPCTCSANLQIYFAPLYIYGVASPAGMSAVLAGALTFIPGSMLHPQYFIVPSAAVVGTFAPAVPSCWMLGPHGSCFPIPDLGTIMPVTGSSLPGALK